VKSVVEVDFTTHGHTLGGGEVNITMYFNIEPETWRFRMQRGHCKLFYGGLPKPLDKLPLRVKTPISIIQVAKWDNLYDGN